MVADHCKTIGILFFLRGQEMINFLEGVSSIIIVRVDHGKRTIYDIDAAKDSMSSSPRFDSSFWNLESFWKIGQFLENVFYFHNICKTISDHFFKIVFQFFLDDENHFFKSCSFGIKNGKIHNDVSLIVDRIDLF